jgi:hypothetical protein
LNARTPWCEGLGQKLPYRSCYFTLFQQLHAKNAFIHDLIQVCRVLSNIDLAPFLTATRQKQSPAAQFAIGRTAAAILQGKGKP